MSLFEGYILGALIVSGLTITWFLTNLPLHVWSLLRLMPKETEIKQAFYCDNDTDYLDTDEKPETWEDWETLVYTQSPFFNELLTCPLCLGTWFSVIVAIILILINGFTWWFLPAVAFSWPVLAFFAYKITQKK